ncbi:MULTISPECIES: DUF4411 family protein [Deinococcus]|uniref:DUF4411 family protein n=1 Tax=Deinococcus rufus TaxID=2136097 RepID=A0ABV7Z7N8_9DEIO|nr:DUF4411 family protein [Deinococcus sp. AB2017081]WQE95486.1 DUF4411 family protein [Deinococcus sp. AB2017081]
MAYCLDSSSLIHAWSRTYPIEHFPSLWANIKNGIDSGLIFVCRDVLLELEKKDDGLHDWLKQNLTESQMLDLDGEVQNQLRIILADYPKFVESRGIRNGADPIVIATSKAHDLTVVSEEQLSLDGKRVKIPNVCQDIGVNCINFMTLIKEVKLRI